MQNTFPLATLWQRSKALATDCLVVIVMGITAHFIFIHFTFPPLNLDIDKPANEYWSMHNPWLFPIELIYFIILWCYFIYSTGKYGRTAGKAAMHLAVFLSDGSKPAGYKQAVLRYAPWMALDAFITLGSYIDRVTHDSNTFPELFKQTSINDTPWEILTSPTLNQILIVTDSLYILFIVATIITYFKSKQRRAPHDFLANTIVVCI